MIREHQRCFTNRINCSKYTDHLRELFITREKFYFHLVGMPQNSQVQLPINLNDQTEVNRSPLLKIYRS